MASDELLAHVPAQRHRVRRIGAAALRPRGQRPRRHGVRLPRDPDDERRLAMAAVRPHARHRARGGLRAGRAPGSRSTARSSTSARRSRTTRSARSPRSSRTWCRGARLTVGDSSARCPQLPGRLHEDPRAASRLPLLWDVERGAKELVDVFARSASTRTLYRWRGHTRIKQIKHLLATGQIDDRLMWQSISREDELTAATNGVMLG